MRKLTKRFTLDDRNSNYIYNYIYELDYCLSIRETVERLNELYDEREQLKKELILWKTSASEEEKHDLITEIISLREENQHLQQDLADSETKNAYITGIILIAITIILLLLIY